MNIYKERGNEIFQKYALGGWNSFGFIVLFTVVFSSCCFVIGMRKYDSVKARQDMSLMKIAIENAKCRRELNFKPKDLETYEGFEPSKVQESLNRFKNKI